MALIKHLKIYNKNYFDALDYVLFQHNELTGKPILDAQNNKVLREEYYLDGINCEPYSFSAECEALNRYYGKNNKPGEIKEHHFIISFDPKDAVECGLTGQRAQELSMEWAQKCLPGFQVLVCTHMDGHNGSGNIHTHLICNSLRKYDVGEDCYAERPGDRKAGNKLHLTLEYLDYMKREVMRICRREGLHQVDLISPAEERKTDREYYAELRRQSKTDELASEMEMAGMKPRKTKFETEKEYLRRAIRETAMKSSSFTEFRDVLHDEYKVKLKESRGRWSYLHPNRQKYITGRALGAAYEKEPLIKLVQTRDKKWILAENEEYEEEPFIPGEMPKVRTEEECWKIFLIRSELRLVVNLQNCAKAQASAAYAYKVKLSNLQRMAETILFVQQNGFESIEELHEKMEKTDVLIAELDKEISTAKKQRRDINEQIHYLGQYLSTKGVYAEFLCNDNKRKYLQMHQASISRYVEARENLKSRCSDEAFPEMGKLKRQRKICEEKIGELGDRKNVLIKDKKTLLVACKNAEEMLIWHEHAKEFLEQNKRRQEPER